MARKNTATSDSDHTNTVVNNAAGASATMVATRGGRSWSEHGQPTDQHHDQPRRGAAEQGVERQRSMEHGHRIVGEPLHGRQQRCVAGLPRAVVVHHPRHATTEEPGHRELGRFVRPERELVAAAGDPQSGDRRRRTPSLRPPRSSGDPRTRRPIPRVGPSSRRQCDIHRDDGLDNRHGNHRST